MSNEANCIQTTIYAPTLWLIKVTFCLLYLHIFRPMRWLRINIYIVAALLTIFYWGFSIALFVFASRNPGESWAELLLSQRFAISQRTNTPMAVGGMILDLWLLALPLVAVCRLQLQQARKIALIIMFSTGSLSVIPILDGPSLMHSCRAVAASAAGIYYRHLFQYAEDKTWILINLTLVR